MFLLVVINLILTSRQQDHKTVAARNRGGAAGKDNLLPTLLPTGRIVVRPPIVKNIRVMTGGEKLYLAGIPRFIMDLFKKSGIYG